jgi:hypothetical protein
MRNAVDAIFSSLSAVAPAAVPAATHSPYEQHPRHSDDEERGEKNHPENRA